MGKEELYEISGGWIVEALVSGLIIIGFQVIYEAGKTHVRADAKENSNS